MSLPPDVAVSGVAADLRPAAEAGLRTEREGGEAGQGAEGLLRRALGLAGSALEARQAGAEDVADRGFREAVALGLQGLAEAPGRWPELPWQTAQWALEGGDVATARELLARHGVRARDHEVGPWAQIGDIERWPDSWLVAAVRRPSPDEAALDTLAQRHWKALFGRCQMLTLKREAAADLAQETWCRILRGRERLRPGGNFRAYLLMIATNLWRDARRDALRAGLLAEGRLSSLDGAVGQEEGVTLGELVPDLDQLEAAERERLKADIDDALSRLEVLWRDVLVARFLDGESCAEIGRRYGRTEQTVSGWVRRAISEMKLCLEDSRRSALSEEPHEN
ncbi:MAG: sigma-70 family RNA polymerase sigma factor [Verrucomicrobia bacterium]|nr:sigma-70 family RNA polymerase sigma factor [Verrucomicrobiota bacterium]